MSFLYAILIGYAFGCINGSQIIGAFKGIDIKNEGVKNAGASNTTILLGWKYGIIVALIDIFKGVFAILLVKYLFDSSLAHYEDALAFLTGVFVILGHNYPITMKFKGGKGTASFIGMLFTIDWKVGAIGAGLLLLGIFLTDYLIVGVFAMYVSVIVTTYVFDYGFLAVICTVFLTALSTYKHIVNFERIRSKTEPKVSSMFKKKKKLE